MGLEEVFVFDSKSVRVGVRVTLRVTLRVALRVTVMVTVTVKVGIRVKVRVRVGARVRVRAPRMALDACPGCTRVVARPPHPHMMTTPHTLMARPPHPCGMMRAVRHVMASCLNTHSAVHYAREILDGQKLEHSEEGPI